MERLTREADEIRAGGGVAEVLVLDVTTQDDAVRVVEQVIGKWGRIGRAGQQCQRHNLSPPPMGHHDGAVGRGDEYKRTGDPPDVPPGLTVHDAGGAGRHHQHRVIILCRLPDGDYGADATSKWGVVSYTASQGHSLRPYGISVNCINPDWVDTIWPGLTILTETRTG